LFLPVLRVGDVYLVQHARKKNWKELQRKFACGGTTENRLYLFSPVCEPEIARAQRRKALPELR
jgi:hypothetical protein